MGAPKVAVVSAFEAKLQPILAASAAGALRSAGAQVTAWDADVCPNDFPGGGFDLVLISIPSYEGIEAGAQLASQFKVTGTPRVLVCGQYAWLNAGALASVTDGVVVDEPEGMTGQLLAYALGEVTPGQVEGIFTGEGTRPKPRRRIARDWQLPARDLSGQPDTPAVLSAGPRASRLPASRRPERASFSMQH